MSTLPTPTMRIQQIIRHIPNKTIKATPIPPHPADRTMKRKAVFPSKKHSVIARKTPEFMPGYPHPECITGGWTALLSEEQKSAVEARVDEMKAIDQDHYGDYTGFDVLDEETQALIRSKLEANKKWEKEFGVVWFNTPAPIDSRLLVSPVTETDKAEWVDLFNFHTEDCNDIRRRQVGRMVANNEYPVRTYIYRS